MSHVLFLVRIIMFGEDSVASTHILLCCLLFHCAEIRFVVPQRCSLIGALFKKLISYATLAHEPPGVAIGVATGSR
jgi:hypothetical protein